MAELVSPVGSLDRQFGMVVVIGGGATQDNYALFASLRRPGSAITIFTGSTETPQQQFETTAARFIDLGVTTIYHLGEHTREEDGVDMIRDTGAIFLEGGNQRRGKQLLEKRRWIGPLKEAYADGILEGGTSAGAMLLGGPVMAYRERIEAAIGVIDVSVETHGNRGRNSRQDHLVQTTGASSLLLFEGGGVMYHQGEVVVFGPDPVRYAFLHEGTVRAVSLEPGERTNLYVLPSTVYDRSIMHKQHSA